MGQYFKHLNYTLGDEDATPEMNLLPWKARHVMAVADCGSRVIPLLARAPQRLTCVDISEPQLAVCELRIALLRQCDLDVFCGFLGYEPMTPERRQSVFGTLALETRTRALLRGMFDAIAWGPLLYQGQFERMLSKLSVVIRLLTGRGGASIFLKGGLDEQRAYYDKGFPKLRWYIALLLLGNSTALNSLLYKGDFPRKNRKGSHFAIYRQIFRSLMTEQSAKSSFFLQMVFFGRLVHREGRLLECDPKVFAEAKQALNTCHVEFRHDDIFEAARQGKDIDFLSLSDVPSFLPSAQEQAFLQRIRPGLAAQALVVVRAHLRLPAPDLKGYVAKAGEAQARQESTRLWSFHLYQST